MSRGVNGWRGWRLWETGGQGQAVGHGVGREKEEGGEGEAPHSSLSSPPPSPPCLHLLSSLPASSTMPPLPTTITALTLPLLHHLTILLLPFSPPLTYQYASFRTLLQTACMTCQPMHFLLQTYMPLCILTSLRCTALFLQNMHDWRLYMLYVTYLSCYSCPSKLSSPYLSLLPAHHKNMVSHEQFFSPYLLRPSSLASMHLDIYS